MVTKLFGYKCFGDPVFIVVSNETSIQFNRESKWHLKPPFQDYAYCMVTKHNCSSKLNKVLEINPTTVGINWLLNQVCCLKNIEFVHDKNHAVLLNAGSDQYNCVLRDVWILNRHTTHLNKWNVNRKLSSSSNCLSWYDCFMHRNTLFRSWALSSVFGTGRYKTPMWPTGACF